MFYMGLFEIEIFKPQHLKSVAKFLTKKLFNFKCHAALNPPFPLNVA